jgi:hypothetical protein
MMTDIQGLFYYNNKTKEYTVKIGSLIFPFKSANEVLAYFLGNFKIAKLRQSREAKCLFFKADSYLSSYLSKKCVFSQNPEKTTIPFLKEIIIHFWSVV